VTPTPPCRRRRRRRPARGPPAASPPPVSCIPPRGALHHPHPVNVNCLTGRRRQELRFDNAGRGHGNCPAGGGAGALGALGSQRGALCWVRKGGRGAAPQGSRELWMDDDGRGGGHGGQMKRGAWQCDCMGAAPEQPRGAWRRPPQQCRVGERNRWGASSARAPAGVSMGPRPRGRSRGNNGLCSTVPRGRRARSSLVGHARRPLPERVDDVLHHDGCARPVGGSGGGRGGRRSAGGAAAGLRALMRAYQRVRAPPYARCPRQGARMQALTKQSPY
jgi:hypothetical protein